MVWHKQVISRLVESFFPSVNALGHGYIPAMSNTEKNGGDAPRRAYRTRKVDLPPRFMNFKPAGVRRRDLDQIVLSLDEYESIRLADYEGLDHSAAAEAMNISRPTFSRLVEKARAKLASSIIEGKELVISGGNVRFNHGRHLCRECGEEIIQPTDSAVEECPDCGSDQVENLAERYLDEPNTD